MKIEIKHRITGSILFERDCENNTIKLTVELAIKSYADLRSADLSSADLRYADLSSADLRYADLRYADLSSADLRYANLSSANLRYANLSSADLRSADLSSADLRYADLSSAYLDMSCLPLQCGSLKMKTDRRIRVQIAFHWLSLIKHAEEVSDDEKEMYQQVMKYANEFHRKDVDKLTNL